MTNITSFVHNIFDNVNKFMYILVGVFILIIITYGSGIKNSKVLSLIFKIAIVGMYFYLFVMNYNYIKTLFDTTGIFSDPALSTLKVFFFLFTFFEISLVIVIMYVLYTILF
jgi:hypothetical protein